MFSFIILLLNFCVPNAFLPFLFCFPYIRFLSFVPSPQLLVERLDTRNALNYTATVRALHEEASGVPSSSSPAPRIFGEARGRSYSALDARTSTIRNFSHASEHSISVEDLRASHLPLVRTLVGGLAGGLHGWQAIVFISFHFSISSFFFPFSPLFLLLSFLPSYYSSFHFSFFLPSFSLITCCDV